MPGRGRRWILVLSMLVLACGGGDEGAARAREQAQQALARGERKAALDALERLRESGPRTPEALLELTTLMVRAGEAPQALWLLEEALARHPARDDLRLQLGQVALLVRDPRRARDVLSRVAPGSDAYLPTLLLLARAELELGDLEAGLARLKEAAARYPDRPEATLARIQALAQERKFEEARQVLEAALANPQFDAPARRRLELVAASLEARQGGLDPAIARLERLVDDDPLDPRAWSQLLQLLFRAGRGSDAVARLEAVMEERPEEPLLRQLLAEAYARTSDPKKAEAALHRWIELADTPSSRLALARFHARRGDPSEAAHVLEEAVAAHPDAVMLRMHQAELELEAERPSAARAALAGFRERAPDDPHVRYLEARLDLADGRTARAESRLRELVSRLDTAYTQFWLGRALELRGDLEGAARRYGLALRRDPRDPACAAALLAVSSRRGDWPTVVAVAQRQIRQGHAPPETVEALVAARLELGEAKQAEDLARKLTETSPQRSSGALLLARALRDQGRHRESEQVLEAALQRAGASPELEAERALSLGLQGRLEAGISLLREITASQPDSATAQHGLARLLFAAGDARGGSQAVDRALAAAPEEPAPLVTRARFLASRERWEAARTDAQRYLEKRPYDAGMHFLLGAVLEGAGDRAGALAAYRRAAALDPGHAASRNNLAVLLAEQGEMQAALRSAQEAYQLAPSDPQVLDTLGWLYLRDGLARRAVPFLERAREGQPDAAEIARHLALAYQETRQEARQEARQERASDARGISGPADAVGPEVARGLRKQLRALGRPNLVLIICDTLRADSLTPYGAEDTSPELARWAERGAVFERVRSQSSWTKTSMSSLMTSLWPSASGVVLRRDGLGNAALTLAEIFQQAGYRTYGVQSNGWLEQTFGFQQGFDRYMFPGGGGNPAMKTSIWPHADNVYREAMRLLDGHDAEMPFFLYLHFMDVHEYAAPPEFHRFGTDAEGAYRAAVRWVDHVVERLRRNLATRQLLEHTVLVFGADHGEAFGENGHTGHARDVFTSVVHVPLLIRFPFPSEPIRVAAQVRNLDVAPTLVDLAGLHVPETLQGRSLLPLMVDPGSEGDRPSFASLDERLFPDAFLQKAVNDGAWSFARNLGSEHETVREFLFDRRVDPAEHVNLIDVEPEQAQRLRAMLDAHLAEPVRREARHRNVRIAPKLAEKLRALGYAADE